MCLTYYLLSAFEKRQTCQESQTALKELLRTKVNTLEKVISNEMELPFISEIQGIRSDRQSAWELWTEFSDTVQEAVIKTTPKKKKCKKAKSLCEEALQVPE